MRTYFDSEYGRDFKVTGYYLDISTGLHESQIKALEEMARPGSDDLIRGHLLELSVIKRLDGGNRRIKMVIDALVKDVSGFSEWAIIETCEHFRKRKIPFFPDVGEFFHLAKNKHTMYENALNDLHKPKQKEEDEQEEYKPMRNSKIRVKRMIKLARKQPEYYTKWERRFMEAMKEKK